MQQCSMSFDMLGLGKSLKRNKRPFDIVRNAPIREDFLLLIRSRLAHRCRLVGNHNKIRIFFLFTSHTSPSEKSNLKCEIETYQNPESLVDEGVERQTLDINERLAHATIITIRSNIAAYHMYPRKYVQWYHVQTHQMT